MKKEFTCSICGETGGWTRFEDYECWECGQIYTFDEGMIILLTEEQWTILKNHYKATG